ncbi:hypothetical protein RSal33209_2738 [Renibacterium salmoninarum ATCC 33209]|uniref:Uncharacterized protein n=1 Tax=Renibacterium salmoninarum (strain ATCC 33209 / DSM 20767 / JCM 11484 / NBRC 15589 / NCIMB 2235) TaxID=288705 RepID=A9WTE2_RENSM|nr:hypothetical protein RSal33209_2738 [Renibacterium salmoninarum ATCC 33209]
MLLALGRNLDWELGQGWAHQCDPREVPQGWAQRLYSYI